MKKQILIFIFAVLAASGVILSIDSKKSDREINQLTLINAEALSSSELHGWLYYWPCSHTSGAQCIPHENIQSCSRLYYC